MFSAKANISNAYLRTNTSICSKVRIVSNLNVIFAFFLNEERNMQF